MIWELLMTSPPSVRTTEWKDGNMTEHSPRDRFRHNLNRIMTEQRVTQASLARTMNVSRVAVHAWIWGACFPETSRLIKLAEALNVTVGDLLEGDIRSETMPGASSNEEALLLDAFRKLPSTARLSLLAEAYKLSARGVPTSLSL